MAVSPKRELRTFPAAEASATHVGSADRTDLHALLTTLRQIMADCQHDGWPVADREGLEAGRTITTSISRRPCPTVDGILTLMFIRVYS